jgi:hypothetical protein
LLFVGLEGCHDAQNHLIMALFIQYGSLAAEDWWHISNNKTFIASPHRAMKLSDILPNILNIIPFYLCG